GSGAGRGSKARGHRRGHGGVTAALELERQGGRPMTVVGTWRVTSFSLLTLDTNEVSRPFGDNPIGYLQYSPGGHMVAFGQTGNPKIYPSIQRFRPGGTPQGNYRVCRHL